MFLLDTNIISIAPKQTIQSDAISKNIIQRFQKFGEDNLLYTSIICYQEVMNGIRDAQRKYGQEYKQNYFLEVISFLNNLQLIDYTKEIANKFTLVKMAGLQNGLLYPSYDLMIAATALEYEFTIVTNNTKDFEKIPNIKLEDWTL
jgi:tRNA(fMet)-specific endonuclease VapC